MRRSSLMSRSCAGAARRTALPPGLSASVTRVFCRAYKNYVLSAEFSAQETAVGDVEHRAVDDHRRLERQPADRLRDFLRLSGAARVDLLHQRFDALGLRFLQQLCLD